MKKALSYAFFWILFLAAFPGWAVGQMEFDAAYSAGDYAEAIDVADRWFAETAQAQAVTAKARVLVAIGRREDARTLLQAHKDILGSAYTSALAEVDKGKAEPKYVPWVIEAPSTTPRDAPNDDVIGWVLLTGGGFSLIGSVVAYFVANSEAESLRCSPVSSAQETGCSKSAEAFTAAEFASKSDTVSTLRFASVIMAGFGVALGGWGLYSILSPKQTLTLEFSPTQGGVDAALRFRY